MNKIIFVDMDGVLSDFNALYEQKFGVPPSTVRQMKDRGVYNEYWNRFIDEKGFYHLPWMQGAQELIEWLDKQPYQKCILSSSGGFDRHSEVQAQKLMWLCDHGITWPAVIVPGSGFKAGFANKYRALIDDTYYVIDAFNDRMGFGVLHKADAKWDTYYQLEKWLA